MSDQGVLAVAVLVLLGGGQWPGRGTWSNLLARTPQQENVPASPIFRLRVTLFYYVVHICGEKYLLNLAAVDLVNGQSIAVPDNKMRNVLFVSMWVH